ncbi:hypothetical protein BDF21DRAFT_497014 [Thamnidium elegans]|nr:hypothetical protein BDF21DRAFT_497014 [Thamnidium elegans]
MTENVLVTPLFHQRSHSMPVGHGFINNGEGNNIKREFDYKRSPLKNETTSSSSASTTTSEMFPLPIPKSIASQLNNSSSTLIDTQDEPNFFCKPKTLLQLFDYNNHKATSFPIVFNCKMDRGFFTSQSRWTCYRRNYFQVTASFIIPGHSEETCYALQLNDKPMQPIQQFYLRLKACTSSTTEAVIENKNLTRPVALTQMTPKRDKGPQREPQMTEITPSNTVYGCEQVCVTFERLQFRVATANNGKRRASQQYFCLIFELIAQLPDNSHHIISECYSSPLVVRGRSPGHYSSDTGIQTARKRKLSDSPNTKRESPVSNQRTLPQPQYVFSPPTLVIDHQQQTPTPPQSTSQQSSTSSSTYNIMPIMTPSSYTTTSNSAFSNFHNRSQSANDSHFYSRTRLKYPIMEHQDNSNNNSNEMFESYQVSMARELRNWQQVVHQRNDSAATYDSFDNNNNNNNRTRPGTPIPYHNYGPWSSNQQQFIENEEKLNNHHV